MRKTKKWFKRNVLNLKVAQSNVYTKKKNSNDLNLMYVNIDAKGKIEDSAKAAAAFKTVASTKNNYDILVFTERLSSGLL
ncbi:hypothetical protein [Staphylococcus phage vB_SauH_DELF3]|nr:hypothetical protein [Staphylococcus phage vB_SauH_DELF3]